MSTTKAAITLPKSIGGTNLVESINKISLSSETKEFLASLEARLTVTWSAGADVPTFEVVDKRGDAVCSIDEFVKLSGFRRWVNDELKKIEKESLSSERVSQIALFLRRAKADKITLPDRMVEANGTKFNQFRSMIEFVNTNLEKIDETIDSDSKVYLKDKGDLLLKLLFKMMLGCMGTDKIDKELFDEELFKCSIPKWVQNKLVDKQFTANLKNDATNLLFPKGNYLKGVSLTTKELKNTKFLNGNEHIVKHSGAIILLAHWDYKVVVPKISEEMKDDVNNYVDNMMWTLNSPYTFEQILDVRVGGKAPPTFKERQRPNPKPGSKARPETDTQRVCREIFNVMGKLTSTFLHFQNLIIQVSNPLEEFWRKVLPKISWEITPTHGLYAHVKDSLLTVDSIKDLDSDPILVLMAEIMCQTLRVPASSNAGKSLIALVTVNFKGNSQWNPKYKGVRKLPTLDVDADSMKAVKLTGEQLNEAREYLGLKKKKTSSSKKIRRGQSSVRLNTRVLAELGMITETDMFPKVKEWLSTTFKTGKRTLLQITAARLIAGEVLQNQDQLLGEDFDEFDALERIEEYEENGN